MELENRELYFSFNKDKLELEKYYSIQYLRNLIHNRKLKSIKFKGRSYILKEDLIKYIKGIKA